MATVMSTDLVVQADERPLDRLHGAGLTALPAAGFHWRRALTLLVALDSGVAIVAATIGGLLRFGYRAGEVESVPHIALLGVLPIIWSLSVLLAGGYDRRFLVTGPDEFRRIVNAAIWLFAGIGLVDFAAKADLSRAFVGISIPLAMVLTLLTRCAARGLIHRRVMAGHPLHRVVVLGARAEVEDLVRHVQRCPQAGYVVAGACLRTGGDVVGLAGGTIPVLGGVDDAIEVARRARADTLAVAGTSALGRHALQQLSWQLEGTGIRLVVAPAITDVAGPRIAVRPVAGLPLLEVAEPQFTGARRVLKGVIDRTAAPLLALLLAPLLAGIALAIRLTSPGPVFFRQERVGLNGRRFLMWKFRTMQDGAQGMDVAHLNEQDGPLFKVRRDPRVTPVGGWLRRSSLDELPQLWNVITGSMSLVGPRPPMLDEVDRYQSHVRRRLLVKPGMTGLWQVSGRSDLSWEEAVRLDLYYVENWSVGMDAMLLWKTLSAVVRARGAY